MPDFAAVPAQITIHQDGSTSAPGAASPAVSDWNTGALLTRIAGDPFQDIGDSIPVVSTNSGRILYHYAAAWYVSGAGLYSAITKIFLDGTPISLWGNLVANVTDNLESMAGTTNEIAAFTDPYSGTFQVNTPGNAGAFGSFALGNKGINFSHGMATAGWGFAEPTALPGAPLLIACTPGDHSIGVRWQVGTANAAANGIGVIETHATAIGL